MGSSQSSDVKQSNRHLRWHRIFFGARTRILVWYIVLMACSALVSILTIRQLLFVRVEERVKRSLVQEVQEFRRLVGGRDPTTGQPFGDDVAAIFDVFLSRNIPEDDEFFIALLNGKVYKYSPRALPKSIKSESGLLEYWAQLTQPEQGEKVTPDGTLLYYWAEPVNILYRAEPVRITDKTHAVFVIAHITTGEREEVDEALIVIIQVMLAVLAVASMVAWLVAGRVLAPLRLLTETARSISESDLTGRIPIKGSDEIAELTITFNEMLDRLQAAFASQRNFINDAGHELRTPITIIRGHLELLGDDPQERLETIDLVTDELDRMSRFVNDLLILAKAEQPNFLNLETVDIGLVTEELYTKATALAVRDWLLDKKESGCIVADRQRLTQAMMNLAQNATQHTTEGDVIALGSAVKDGNARLWVRDTGEGIPFAEQERIFERFARASTSRRRSEGAGLGLAIVRAIALAHGGRIELLSRPGGGSTFTLVIPLEISPDSA